MERLIFAFAAIAICIRGEAFGQISCNIWTRFECWDGACISKAKVCNGKNDCLEGEDEENCNPQPPDESTCYPRNQTMADLNGYGRCRQSCSLSRDCRSKNKICVCDDECGFSCLNPSSECLDLPPIVPHSDGREVVQNERAWPATYVVGAWVRYTCLPGMKLNGPPPRCSGRKVWSNEVPQCIDIACRGEIPSVRNSTKHSFLRPRGSEFIRIDQDQLGLVNDVIEYICDGGLLRLGNPPRCGKNHQWTPHSIRCVVPCFEPLEPYLISRLRLTCGRDCDTSSNCSNGEICHCDGPCGRVCVNPNVQCPEAPTIRFTTLNYTGNGINKIARYSCNEGFYLRAGFLSLRCSGSGVWLGNPPECEAVYCGDPGLSIMETGGEVFSYEGTHFKASVEFFCRSNYKMLGFPRRTCMGNGRWSGQLTVCDLRDGLERCPHPGIPINGGMSQISGKKFAINSTVRFYCDQDYILVGDAEQTCLWFQQWSGRSTPLCIDPKYPHGASDVIDTLSRSLANLPGKKPVLGRSLMAHETDRPHEVYFIFDVSVSVLNRTGELKQEMEFAKRFVRRMDEFKGKIKYGIMVFASTNVTALDITREKVQTTESITKVLDDVYQKAANETYKKKTRGGTATGHVLEKLESTIAFQKQNLDTKTGNDTTKRHIFIFTDGRHTEGIDPVKIRKKIESRYKPNIEFYSITACGGNCQEKNKQELMGLASIDPKTGKKNYIYIEDFYQLSTYLDRVTDVKIDFSKCGQAGPVGSIKKQAKVSLGRSAGGEDAEESAWPWQVLITKTTENRSLTFENKYMRGGGSILSNKWVLSAAHLFYNKWGRRLDAPQFVVTGGIFNRPNQNEAVTSSVQMFRLQQIYLHPNYSLAIYANDIALIKLGARIDPSNMKTIANDKSGFVYSNYVRPVCLPCTGTCLTKDQLTDIEGNSLITGQMTADEICRTEETKLLVSNAKTVVTGFGHYNQSEIDDFSPMASGHLQQTLLHISSNETCRNGLDELNTKMIKMYPDFVMLQYTNKMFCCESSKSDACKGDSGGPLVREVLDDTTRESCWVQIGIVSFGYGCQSGKYPGYYTKVSEYIPWIREKIGDQIVPNP